MHFTRSNKGVNPRIIFYNPECNDVSYDMTDRYIIQHFFGVWGREGLAVKTDASEKFYNFFKSSC